MRRRAVKAVQAGYSSVSFSIKIKYFMKIALGFFVSVHEP